MRSILATIRQRILPPKPPSQPQGGEQSAEWYDSAFAQEDTDYHQHYTASRYHFIWAVIVDRVPRLASVLEIGCGPGQLAEFLIERGVAHYIGFDFSSQAIRMAKKRCPSVDIHLANALETPLLDDKGYDTVICTEVLEHIEADLKLLSRIRAGVRCLITVPNFPYPSHVRYFADEGMVAARYGAFFRESRIDRFRATAGSTCYFLLDGERSSYTGL
jgi:SAM-dependent methyltransferase